MEKITSVKIDGELFSTGSMHYQKNNSSCGDVLEFVSTVSLTDIDINIIKERLTHYDQPNLMIGQINRIAKEYGLVEAQ
jgi:hypothetical protein